MTDNTTYSGFEILFPEPKIPRCADCHYWDAPNAIDGWATCYQLVHSNKKWELGTVEEVPQGDTAIVKTYQRFYCKYFEEIE